MEKRGDVTMPLAKYEELLTKNVNLLNDNLQMSHKIEELINNDGQKVIVVEEYDDDTFISFIGFDEIKDEVEKATKKSITELEESITELEENIAKLKEDNENLKALVNVYKKKKNELVDENKALKNRSLWQRIINKQD